MDVRIAASAMVPMVAAGALGVAAAFALREPSPSTGDRITTEEAFPRAPEFVGNCDRSDMAAIDRWAQENRARSGQKHFRIMLCTPNHAGQRAAFVTLWSTFDGEAEVHLIGAGLQDLAEPRIIPMGDLCEPEPRMVDLDGDGVDEIVFWAPTLDVMAHWSGTPPDQSTVCARVIAVRDGKLAMSRERRYKKGTDPVRVAHDIFDHEPLTAEK